MNLLWLDRSQINCRSRHCSPRPVSVALCTRQRKDSPLPTFEMVSNNRVAGLNVFHAFPWALVCARPPSASA
ncbi:unnamed protein product [Arctogadus glacialis]